MYAISYDDVAALNDFSKTYDIQFPLLADVKSEVIRSYQVLNTEVPPGDLPAYGVPFPATFASDVNGVLTNKFIHRSYKIRSSPEHLIDSIKGNITIDPNAPTATAEHCDVKVTAYFHGGRGTLRQGIERQVVVRIEAKSGTFVSSKTHATTIEVSGPPGLMPGDTIWSSASTVELTGEEAQSFGQQAELVVPVFAQAELISECRPIENDSIRISVTARVAVSDGQGISEVVIDDLAMVVYLEPVDMPKLRFHGDTGQRRSDMESAPHFKRLVMRQFRNHPIGAIRSILNTQRAQRQAAKRAKGA